VLYPYGRHAPPRPAGAIDTWLGPGWRLLERHQLLVSAPPPAAVEALAGTRLRDLSAVAALFRLRGLRFSPEMSLRAFFSAPPFLLLEEETGRELVFGVQLPPASRKGRRQLPGTPAEFRAALPQAPLAAIGTFRAEPSGAGALLWTETWARTSGAGPRLLFGAYWLAIGPWSAWTRRLILRAARDRCQPQATLAVPPGGRHG